MEVSRFLVLVSSRPNVPRTRLAPSINPRFTELNSLFSLFFFRLTLLMSLPPTLLPLHTCQVSLTRQIMGSGVATVALTDAPTAATITA